MFEGCTALQNLNGITKWDTSNVKNMSAMFCGCKKLKKINLINWNTENVLYFSGMFYECEELKSLKSISKFNFSKRTYVLNVLLLPKFSRITKYEKFLY